MAGSSELMRISKELAAEIRKTKKNYADLGVDKSYTDCSKDLAAEIRLFKMNKKSFGERKGGIW